jgi:ribosomal protein S18 acetylase RimI-like enzyme
VRRDQVDGSAWRWMGLTLSDSCACLAMKIQFWGSCIDNLHVAPKYHGLAVGTELMLRTAEWLDRMYPRSGVYLWVMEANSPARRFYERLGARHCGTSNKRDPGGGYALNCRYVWTDPKAILTPTR